MSAPVKLIPQHVSTDTVACLRQLLDKAVPGEMIGIAFAAIFEHGNYIVDTAGEAHRNPTLARGMIQVLDDKLAARIQEVNP